MHRRQPNLRRHGDRLESQFTFRHGFDHRCSFGTGGQRVGSVLDIAAGVNFARRCQQRRSNPFETNGLGLQ